MVLFSTKPLTALVVLLKPKICPEVPRLQFCMVLLQTESNVPVKPDDLLKPNTLPEFEGWNNQLKLVRVFPLIDTFALVAVEKGTNTIALIPVEVPVILVSVMLLLEIWV